MRNTLILGILIVAICSCSQSEKKMQEKNKLLVQIQQAEKQFYNDSLMTLNINAADSAVNLYVRFANNFADDFSSAEYLFRAAGFCKTLNKGKLALIYYERIENNYPDFPKMPICIFMQGFVNEELADYDKARFHYQRFIDKYPNHPLVKDTKIMIENLGKSPEELIKLFQKKEKNKSSPNTSI
ncbi:MAG: hypothetical protein COX07_07490 [Bacteroidetes bacterium CG23_combo_of_CG06-09_8_20_14_all_32_9]|nr:MAG: hypothetical protein COX07_07490 [Bacteroidetes bacterium CG23_combo_of_CG06-09_8_20_14_all_32_9]